MRPAGDLLCCMTDRDARSVPGRPAAARSPEDLRFTGDPAGVRIRRGIHRQVVEQDSPLLWGRREPGTLPLARGLPVLGLLVQKHLERLLHYGDPLGILRI